MLPQPNAVVFDVDGTLADVSGLLHLVDYTHPDFGGVIDQEKFHQLAAEAPPRRHIVLLARAYAGAGISVQVVTGRPERLRGATQRWLAVNEVPHEQLHMREDGDTATDLEIKSEILAQISQHYNVIAAVDDSERAVALWRSRGISAHLVGEIGPMAA